MSNLTNQYISQSYQSVLNVGASSGQHLTTNLQPITDGLGNNSSLNLSTTQAAISGTLNMYGSVIPSVSGAFDLGSPAHPWRHIYAGSGSYYLDGNRVLGLDATNNTTLFAPSNSNELRFKNNVVLDSANTGSQTGGPTLTHVGGGILNTTTTIHTGSSHWHYTDGNHAHFNVLGPDDTTSTGSVSHTVKNKGSFLITNGNDGGGSFALNVNEIGSSMTEFVFTDTDIKYNGSGSLYFDTSGSYNFRLHQHNFNIGDDNNNGIQISPSGSIGNDTDRFDISGLDIHLNGSNFVTDLNISGSKLYINSGSIIMNGQTGSVNRIEFPFMYGTEMQSPSIIFQNNNGNLQLAPNAQVDITPNKDNLIGGSAGLNITSQGNNAVLNINSQYPSIYFQQDPITGQGSQYPIANMAVDGATYTTGGGIFGGFQIYDSSNYGFTLAAIAANSYASETSGSLAGWIGGGANNDSGSNTAIIFPVDSPNMEVYKPTNFHYPIGIPFTAGGNHYNNYIYSLNDSGILNFAGEGNLYSFGDFYTGSGQQVIVKGSEYIYDPGNNSQLNVGLDTNFTPNSAYPSVNVGVDDVTYSGNVYGNLAIINPNTTSTFASIAASTYEPGYEGTTVGIVGGGMNDENGTMTALVFHQDSTNMDVIKPTNFNKPVTVNSSISSTNSYTQVNMTANQTVSAGSDTVVQFNNVNVNNNGWFDTGTNTFTPTVAGTYEITFLVQVATGTGNGQMNAQVNYNGSQILIVQDEINKNQNHTLQGSVLVYLNGSTDNVKITFFTSSNTGNQVIQAGAGSIFKAVLL